MTVTALDTVTMPGYTLPDAAAISMLAKHERLQVKVENVFNKRY